MSRARHAVVRACRRLAVLAAIVPLACLAAAQPSRTDVPPAAGPEGMAAAESRRLREALTWALDDPAGRADLRLLAEGFDGGDYSKVEVFGRGVGIWDGERQFRATQREIEAAIRATLGAGFPEMAPTYGGAAEGRRRQEEPTGGGPVRLVRAVEIEAGEVARRVEQVAGGEQHAPLVELAAGLLARWRAAGEAGVGASSLDDGLARIAARTLAPETLRLTLHEKPELGTEGTGLLLQLRGRGLSWRSFDSAAGYGAPRAAELTTGELRALAGRIAELAPGRLPGNLFAPAYLDLTLEVLGHRVSVQARRFAGMTAATHGAVQRDFDRLLDSLRALEGRLPDAAPGSPRGGRQSVGEPPPRAR